MSKYQSFIYKSSDLATSALRLLPAELAHDLGIFILNKKLHKILPTPSYKPKLDLSMSVPSLGTLEHPVGLAAGFDKNARAVDGFSDLGFSFLEVGTVTPRPQPGNPKPRLFRYKDQMGIVNRMGFNNNGAAAMKSQFQKGQFLQNGLTVGVNLGKNKDTPQEHAISDYMSGLSEMHGQGSYYVINISSPNTPGLRELASKAFLAELSTEISSNYADTLSKVWVKVDPDLDKKHFQEVTEAVADSGFAGIILTNTHRVEIPEMGGQSGHPVSVMSSQRLEWAHEVTSGVLPMIGVGGILSGGDVFQKVIRGASMVQIYTAMVYRGPWTVHKILQELEWELELRGMKSLKEAHGSFYR
jgi:dihydroorotate dehydrogenase